MKLPLTFSCAARQLTSFAFGVTLLTGMMALPSIARANVQGLWSCDFTEAGQSDSVLDVSLFDSNGNVSGGEYLSTDVTTQVSKIFGTAVGNSYNVTVKSLFSNASITVSGSVTVAGDTMSGSWINGSDSGGFSCLFLGAPIGVAPGGKRPTSTFLFCNRVGVNLSTADCAVTVGDAGAPPRSAPTGAVDFISTNGFSPSSGSCTLAPTPNSPGIVSCNAEFTIPAGFPIGIAFPIDAAYEGDSVFDGSGTVHTAIQAGCVGDANTPCSGAVALTFADIPQVLSNAINAVFEYGSSTASFNVARSLPARTLSPRFGAAIQCVAAITGATNLGEILAGLGLDQIETLAHSISNKDAAGDGLLKAVQALDDPKNQTQLEDSLNDEAKMLDLLNKIIQQQSKTQKDILNNVRSLDTSDRKLKKISTLILGSVNIQVKNNSTKKFKLKLNSTAAKLFKALRKAQAGGLDVSLTMKGKRSKGPKKPFNTTAHVEVGLGK